MLSQNWLVVVMVRNIRCLINALANPQAVPSTAQVSCMEKVPTAELENVTIALNAPFNNIGDGQFNYGSLPLNHKLE